MEIIERYLKEGKFDLAARVVDRLRSSGESAEIVEALHEQIQEKKKALRLEELLTEGSSFFDDDHFDLALECFNEALSLDPENARALDWVRKTHQRESDRRLRQSIENFLEKGRRLMELRQFSDAARVFLEATKLNPSDTEAGEMYRIAQEAVERSQREEACHRLCHKARGFLEKGKREEAVTMCRQAVEMLPDFKEAETILQEVEEIEKNEIITLAVKQIQSLALRRKYNLALSLAGETVAKTGMDPRLQTCIRNVHRQKLQIWLLAVGIAAVIALAVLVLVLPGRSGPPAPAGPPAGVLVMDVRPAAKVLKVVGPSGQAVPVPDPQMPLRLSLPPGKYSVTYENKSIQNDPVTETVTVESGKSVVLSRKFPGFNPGSAIDAILGVGETGGAQ